MNLVACVILSYHTAARRIIPRDNQNIIMAILSQKCTPAVSALLPSQLLPLSFVALPSS